MVKVAKWINEAINEAQKYQLPSSKEERREFMQKFKIEIFKNKQLLQIAKEVKTLCQNYRIY
jgi:glycine/serine hydroxymethyltransferase